MTLRQQSLPYIYGYKSQLNKTAKGLKDEIRKTEGWMVENALDYQNIINTDPTDYSVYDRLLKKELREDYQDKRILLDARYDKYKEITSAMLERLIYWADPIQNSVITLAGEATKKAHELSIRDGKQKLINALKNYKGEDKEYVSRIIKEIRKENISMPYGLSTKYQDHAESEAQLLVETMAKTFAALVAKIVIKKRSSDAEKLEEIEKEVATRYRSLPEANTTSKGLLWLPLAFTLPWYYDRQKVKIHQWIIDNPQDTPCIIAANEIVKVGEPFSNGYIYAGRVHKYCHCTTIPKTITNDMIKHYIRIYNLR